VQTQNEEDTMKKLSELCARSLRGALSLAVALAFSASAALAQVPSFQNPPFQPSTFMAAFTVTPAATTSTDFACITGSASRLIKIKSVSVNGIANTTVQTALVSLIKRSAANTGGTATQATGVPLDSSQVVAAPTAVVNVYTGAPTPGAAVGVVFDHYLALALPATAIITDEYEWYFHPQDLYSDVRLRGVTQQLCLNNPAVWLTTPPTLAVSIIWTEQ
jgi:hypothetical protein